MKHRILQRAFTLLAVILLCFPLSAQKLTVEGMELLPNDATASMEDFQRQDLNGNYAGVVKVMLAVSGATFEGGGVLEQQKHMDGEYWVWLAKDSKRIKVHAPGYLPLELNFFNDYKILIESKRTYRLVLTMPAMGQAQQDDGMQYLLLNVTPTDATVKVDGKLQQTVNGVAKAILPPGTHTYEVSAVGYASKTGDVVMSNHKEEVSVRLESLMARLEVKCPTAGARVYVNDDLMGTVPWTGSLNANYYKVEVRKEGYRSQSQTVNLSEKENRALDFLALSAIVGRLNVDYQPTGSDVYIDGQKVGTTPDIFRNVQVGNRKVELRASGYTSKQEHVTIEEGQTAMLSGSLERQQIVQSQSQVQTVASSASGGQIENFTVKGVSFTMVRVDGGELMIGNTIEQDSVSERGTFSQAKKSQKAKLFSFMIGETEVTQALWKAIMGNKNPISDNDYSIPVDSVTWNDCMEFISKLNKLTGKKFRLPTEDEWEYAARGGNKSKHFKYSGSNVLNDVAWNEHNSGKTIHPIKTRKPNELNIYDMSGNVWEWCADILDWSHNQTQPPGNLRAYRGGSCTPYSSGCQVSSRVFASPKETYRHVGFRLAL